MNPSQANQVRIGEHAGRIIRVLPSGVEYADEAGVIHTIDLPPKEGDSQRRYAGMRGASDTPPWFEFFGPPSIRMVFDFGAALYQELLVPLSRAGWLSHDGT